jgi:hypothetical protein
MTMRKVAMPVLVLVTALAGLAGCEKRPAEPMPQTGTPSTSTTPMPPASAASQ